MATPNGIGRIYFQLMTLREKAEYYEKDMELIRRTPYGFVSEVSVTTPGDKSEIRHHDSDNDGLWTSMYGAGEAFAYGATKDPIYKQRADRAFEALRFLQKVTQGGEHAPPRGYVARTDPAHFRPQSERRPYPARHRGSQDRRLVEGL